MTHVDRTPAQIVEEIHQIVSHLPQELWSKILFPVSWRERDAINFRISRSMKHVDYNDRLVMLPFSQTIERMQHGMLPQPCEILGIKLIEDSRL